MFQLTFPAPRALAASLMALSETIPDLAMDVAEAPNDATLYRYTFFLPEEAQTQLTEALQQHGITPQPTDFSPVPTGVDYVAAMREQFPPLEVGPFFIARNNEPFPKDKIGLNVAPNMAFGSGEHATTSGCLAAYAALAESGKSFQKGLDFGCGSGILAMAAAKLQGFPVLCVDNDPPSVQICQENATLNGTDHLLECREGATPPTGQTFDIIFANILLEPLLQHAEALANGLKTGGFLILSGYTDEQSPQISAKYSTLGLTRTAESTEKGWVTSVWKKG